jgi:hypothetical protein
VQTIYGPPFIRVSMGKSKLFNPVSSCICILENIFTFSDMRCDICYGNNTEIRNRAILEIRKELYRRRDQKLIAPD